MNKMDFQPNKTPKQVFQKDPSDVLIIALSIHQLQKETIHPIK